MKLKSQETTTIYYPLRREIAPVLLGVALGMTGCTSTPQPKDSSTQTSQTEIEKPTEIAGGDMIPVEPVDARPTTQGTTCDINTSRPNQIKHPTALAGKIVAPRR